MMENLPFAKKRSREKNLKFMQIFLFFCSFEKNFYRQEKKNFSTLILFKDSNASEHNARVSCLFIFCAQRIRRIFRSSKGDVRVVTRADVLLTLIKRDVEKMNSINPCFKSSVFKETRSTRSSSFATT
jgi:hypothetical protein